MQQRPQLGPWLAVSGDHERRHPQRVAVLDHDQPVLAQLLVHTRR
jgi:hypothetical protein